MLKIKKKWCQNAIKHLNTIVYLIRIKINTFLKITRRNNEREIKRFLSDSNR